MSDQPSPFGEDEISRLLADAQVREPMPEDVATRLDRVLDELAEERSTAGVIPLSRRRRPARLLLAAAAVAVVATGGVVAVDRMQSGGADTTAAGVATQADRDAAGSAPERALESAPDPTSDDALAAPAPQEADQQDSTGAEAYDGQLNSTLSALPTLSTEHFARDAGALVKQTDASALVKQTDASAPAAGRRPAPSCAPPVTRTSTGTHVLAVRIDNRPAWLLVGPVEGTPAARVVAALACDGIVELARTVVPEEHDGR